MRPVFHHHIFQFVVQKFFGSALVGRVHFDEIGQKAEWFEVGRVHRAKKTLDRLGGISAVRKNVFERRFPRFQMRAIAADTFDLSAQFGGCGLLRAKFLFGAMALA